MNKYTVVLLLYLLSEVNFSVCEYCGKLLLWLSTWLQIFQWEWMVCAVYWY